MRGLVAWIICIIVLHFNSAISGHQLTDPNFQIVTVKGKKGLQDAYGKTVIPAKYEDLGWSNGENNSPLNQVIGYKQNGLWGLISVSNKKITSPEFAALSKTDLGYIIAAKSGRLSRSYFYGLYNAEGEIIIPCQYLSMQESAGSIIVSERMEHGMKYGVADHTGAIKLDIEYDRVSRVSDNLLFATNESGWGKVFNTSNFSIMKDSISRISEWESYFIVSSGFKSGLLDVDGNELVPIAYKAFQVSYGAIEGIKFPEWLVLSAQNETIHSFSADKMSFIDSRIVLNSEFNDQLLNQQYELLTPPNLGEIRSVVGNKVLYHSNSKFGIYDLSKNKSMLTGFDTLALEGEFVYAGLFNKNNWNWSVYDTFGIERSKFDYQDIRLFDNRLFAVKRRDHWGFMNRNGKEIIHCVYDSVGRFQEDKVVVDYHGEQGVINENSDWVVIPAKSKVEWLRDSLLLRRSSNKTHLEDIHGNLIYFTEYPVKYVNDLLWEYRTDSTVVRIDLSGRIIENTTVKNIIVESKKYLEDPWFAVKIDGSYGFIDSSTGKLRITNRYEDVGRALDNLISVRILGKWGAINKDEQLIIQPNYDQEIVFNYSIAIVKEAGKYGVINRQGEDVLMTEYDSIWTQENGRSIIEKDEKYGLIDANGQILINPKYESISDLNNGYVIIQKGRKYGLTTLNGVNTIPQIFDQIIYNPQMDVYFAQTNQKWQRLLDEQ